jgi:hypothetical protein
VPPASDRDEVEHVRVQGRSGAELVVVEERRCALPIVEKGGGARAGLRRDQRLGRERKELLGSSD